MSAFFLLRLLWNTFLILGGAFVLYVLLTYPFQKHWIRAKIRTKEWLKREYFRGTPPSGFVPVGEAVTELAGSLDKLIRNHGNSGGNSAIKSLRAEAKKIVISICESVSGLLEHWESLQGLDLVGKELEERARRDSGNIRTLHENLDAFRASFQRAAVSQSAEKVSEASERIVEISHFTKLMSESIASESERSVE